VSTEEAALVRRCLKGDGQAVESLVAHFQGPVYSLCVRLLSHRHDAEDVTQEVFLRVFRSLRRWDPSRPLKPWIMAIAINRCRTWLTQKSRRPAPVDYLQDEVAAPAADNSVELVGEIRAALTRLRPEFREAFVLYHEHGQSYADIALALDCPVGTVKTWLHRARLELLERLEERGMVPSGLREPQTRLETHP
jgi:RNA polymerase sigma factor (sigma-70 family)